MYTTGQEVTIVGVSGVYKFECLVMEHFAYYARVNCKIELTNGKRYWLDQIRPYKPRKAPIHQSTYPRNHMVSNRRV